MSELDPVRQHLLVLLGFQAVQSNNVKDHSDKYFIAINLKLIPSTTRNPEKENMDVTLTYSGVITACVQLQAHLDSAQRQQRTEQDLNMVIQKKSGQLEEEQRR